MKIHLIGNPIASLLLVLGLSACSGSSTETVSTPTSPATPLRTATPFTTETPAVATVVKPTPVPTSLNIAAQDAVTVIENSASDIPITVDYTGDHALTVRIDNIEIDNVITRSSLTDNGYIVTIEAMALKGLMSKQGVLNVTITDGRVSDSKNIIVTTENSPYKLLIDEVG